jgi:diguanylate cyclase (GGDEF)-like protein
MAIGMVERVVSSSTGQQTMRILIVEDSQTQAVDLRRRLEALGHEVSIASNGLQAWEQLQARPVPLVILDWIMPVMNGLELCKKIRSEMKSPYIYLILLTAKTHRHERLQGLNAGADDFLAKPIESIELDIALKTAMRIISAQEALQTRARELEQANEQLARLASMDEMTGLKNLRGYHETVQKAVSQALEDRLPLSLLRIEFDHVDELMAGLGDRQGEEFLTEIATLLREEIRECDTAARVSDHGFGLVLPGLPEDSAVELGEILRRTLVERFSQSLPLTVSVGTASIENAPDASGAHGLIEQCETALSRAKARGGNQVSRTVGENALPVG